MNGGERNLLLRRAILAQLEAASPASLPLSTLAAGLQVCGFNADAREIAGALDYLAQKGFAELSHSAISAAHLRAKLSAAGRDYLESGEV